MNLKDAPIQRKLTTIVLLTSGVVVLLTCAAFITYELITFRRAFIEETTTMASVIAGNSTAALAFGDEKVGAEILATLSADPKVLVAALYGADGRLFATFPAGQPP